MKFFKAMGTAILLVLLFASIALTLAAAAVRFAALNPKYLKAFMPTKTYCAEMRERLSEDLDHVALLYGVDGTALSETVTDDAIRSYTNRMIDALFAENATAPLTLPAFPAFPPRVAPWTILEVETTLSFLSRAVTMNL